MPIHVTDASFEADVLQSENPVLVDFWAEWFGPCKQIALALEELDEELGDRLTVAKVDIDNNPESPTKYGVRGIPTLILFKGGEVAAPTVGSLPQTNTKAWLESVLVACTGLPVRARPLRC